jgi:hypothetical protein
MHGQFFFDIRCMGSWTRVLRTKPLPHGSKGQSGSPLCTAIPWRWRGRGDDATLPANPNPWPASEVLACLCLPSARTTRSEDDGSLIMHGRRAPTATTWPAEGHGRSAAMANLGWFFCTRGPWGTWSLHVSTCAALIFRASPKGCEKIDAKTMYWGLC